MSAPLPAVSICGWSGSGKTALIAELVPRLRARGLSVVVIKHHAHRLGVEGGREHKDSERFFASGADTVLVAPEQILVGLHPGQGQDLPELVSRLDAHYDVIVCEGFKSYRFALKIWLQKFDGESPPAGVPGVHRALGPRDDRVAIAEGLIADWLQVRLKSTPVLSGVLMVHTGEQDQRSGQPHRLQRGNPARHLLRALEERTGQTVLLAPGRSHHLPQRLLALPPVQGLRPPLAQMAAAMRWRPDAAWIFLAEDYPAVSGPVIEWLCGLRRPGLQGILVRWRRTRSLRPVLALLEPRARAVLERASSLSGLAAEPRVVTLPLPEETLVASG